MREIAKLGLKLLLIAAVAGLALGGVYVITAKPIAEQTIAAQNSARQTVLPDAVSFEQDGDFYKGLDADGNIIGYCTARITKGYGGDIEVTVGANLDGVITGVSIGGENFSETASLGARAKEPWFWEQFIGKTGKIAIAKDGGDIGAISSATITSRAVTNCVNSTLEELIGYMEGGN
ncbi:MAG: FMN-binding protein [Eubacteriales bacterium]|nr:FMN-binding protein [Eubacteriales bacterium]